MSLIKRLTKTLKKITTKAQYEAIRRQFRKVLKFCSCRISYPHIYKKSAAKPLDERKVLFIETTAQSLSDNFKLIWERLEAYDYEKKVLFLHKNKGGQVDLHKRYKEIVREAGDAKYIFLNDAFLAFGHIHFRPGTIVVNTWHGCGAFKKFGFGTADLNFGETREIQEKYPNYTFLNELYVSAPEVVDKFAYSTGLPEEKVLPVGISRTDMFFDASFKEAAREKFRLYFPGAEGKKVILYAPTFRGTMKGAKAPNALSVSMLQEALSDEYVLVIKQHPIVKHQLPLTKKEQEFAVNFTNVMSIEELLCVTDICISDYSSLVFEFSLFEKPMIFFAFDRAEYDDWRGFYYDYDEMTPGPVFKKNTEIIDYIRNIDERFDRQEVVNFKNKFMSSCDGHATDRIIGRIFTDLEQHKNRISDAEKVKKKAADEEQQEACRNPEEVRNIIDEWIPAAVGKTLVAYTPVSLHVESYPHVEPYVDWIEFYEKMPETCVMLYLHDGRGSRKIPFTSDYIFKVTDEMGISVQELCSCADIVIMNVPCESQQQENTYYYIPEFKWMCSSIAEYERRKAAYQGRLFEETGALADAVFGREGRKAMIDEG